MLLVLKKRLDTLTASSQIVFASVSKGGENEICVIMSFFVQKFHMPKILIIEDNKTTAAYLAQGLQEHRFITDIAYNGQDGLHMAETYSYDLITLDVMLPVLDGWTVLQQLRQRRHHTPVLFLTAKDQIADRVKGFDLQADDYLIKPFAFSELLARIQALLRRASPIVHDFILQVADLQIDVRQYKVWRGKQILALTAKEFQVLLLLAQHQGDVLSRTLIAEKVWDMHFNSDTNIIDVAIKRLRDKIDKDFSPKLIHAVRGVGYVLEIR